VVVRTLAFLVLRLAVHPVVLGVGRKLFAEPQQRLNLRAEKSNLLDGQVVVTSYKLAE
jgi:hypothetical protein